MCIIAIKPRGQKLWDDATIRTMFQNNPHGAGYMFCDGRDVVIQKGFMDADSLLKSLHQRDFTKTNLVLHFRIKTSGKKDAYNCHPFPIYDKNKLSTRTDIALAHNGVLRQFEPSYDSKINDTQVFIRNVLRPLKRGFQSNDNVTYLIGRIIGTNKFAFLDNKNNVTLIGDFITDNGYIYSNESYKPKQKVVEPKIVKREFDWLYDDEEKSDDLWKELDKKYALW